MSTDRSHPLSSALATLLPGALLALSPLELGMAVRLAVAHETNQLPALTTPHADAALAQIAHAAADTWPATRARIAPFTTFLPPTLHTHADASAASESPTTAHTPAPSLSAQRAAAGARGAAARWSRQPATPTPTPTPAPTLPSGLPSSLPSGAIADQSQPLLPSALPCLPSAPCAAQRTSSNQKCAAPASTAKPSIMPAWMQTAPAPTAPTPTPTPTSRSPIATWRSAQIRTLLESAITTWRAAGLIRRGDRELAEDINTVLSTPNITPAAVDIAITRASGVDKTGNRIRMPMAFLLKTLCRHQGDARFQFTLDDRTTVDRWATLERAAITGTTPTPIATPVLTGGAA